MLDSAYEPVKTRAAPAPSFVHPSDCQPVGSDAVGEAEGEGEVEEDEDEVVELDDDAVEDEALELELELELEEDDDPGPSRTSFLKMLIR